MHDLVFDTGNVGFVLLDNHRLEFAVSIPADFQFHVTVLMANGLFAVTVLWPLVICLFLTLYLAYSRVAYDSAFNIS